jgi:hypothetical protein
LLSIDDFIIMSCVINFIWLGGSGPLLCMAGISPIFYSFYLHIYVMYAWYLCIFLPYTLFFILYMDIDAWWLSSQKPWQGLIFYLTFFWVFMKAFVSNSVTCIVYHHIHWRFSNLFAAAHAQQWPTPPKFKAHSFCPWFLSKIKYMVEISWCVYHIYM